MTAPVRAVLYLRLSTTRQAEVDLSIPDQQAQTSAYCARRGWRIVAEYVEPAQFDAYRGYGLSIGFKMVFSGPLVRSSYMADLVSREARPEPC